MPEKSRQWQFLRKTAELGRTPHALLFYGKSVPIKRTLALDLIKLLNCQNEKFEARPCSACRACSDIEKNTHPDLVIVEPEESKEIKIIQIRNLQNILSFKAYSAPFKAAVIDQAHLLNQEAQSAFLKILEDPKGNALFILITDYPEMLLPTILSRVEKIRFCSPSARERDKKEEARVNEIIKLSGQNLFSRFQYAKNLTEDSANLREILDVWLNYFREKLWAALDDRSSDYSLAKLKKILETIQNISFLISTTNINARLALEILMLEL